LAFNVDHQGAVFIGGSFGVSPHAWEVEVSVGLEHPDPLGLYAAELDPRSDHTSGTLLEALTHLVLIQAVTPGWYAVKLDDEVEDSVDVVCGDRSQRRDRRGWGGPGVTHDRRSGRCRTRARRTCRPRPRVWPAQPASGT
jgi:hypothetical protein